MATYKAKGIAHTADLLHPLGGDFSPDLSMNSRTRQERLDGAKPRRVQQASRAFPRVCGIARLGRTGKMRVIKSLRHGLAI